MEAFLDGQKWVKPEYGTSLRGVEGRNPGDYSNRVMGNDYRTPQMKGAFQIPDIERYDTPNLQQVWKTPRHTSFARTDLSRPGYVPRVEDFHG